jgi:hypothetical protein
VSSADEDAEVRVVTCATRACAPGEPTTLRTVRFGDPSGPQLGPTMKLTDGGGLPVTRFVDDVLYVAEQGGADRTTLHVVKLFPGRPRETGRVALRGRIASLVPRERSVVALGTTGTRERGMQLVVHDVDVQRREAPRVRGSVAFGSDWTWTVANDDENALSFDPGSRLAALPFSAWRRADARYATGTQLVDLGRGATPLSIPSDGLVERAVFVDGRLVTIGANGVSSYDYASLFNPARELE